MGEVFGFYFGEAALLHPPRRVPIDERRLPIDQPPPSLHCLVEPATFAPVPTRILLFAFIAAFVFYLVKGVPKGLRKGSTYRVNRAVQTRYWIFLVVFIAFLVLVLKMI